jgi:hypothetical protein
MAFPHPKSRNDHHRKEDKPNSWGILRNFFKRTLDITEYWSAKYDVNPAKNRPFDALVHGAVLYDFAMMSDEIVEARNVPLIMA